MPTQRSRRGRPPKPQGERKRQNVTLRLREVAKEQLETAATNAGHTLSEEIQERLDMSLQDPRIYGLLRLVAASIEFIERYYKASIFESRAAHIAAVEAATNVLAKTQPEEDAAFKKLTEKHAAEMAAFYAEYEKWRAEQAGKKEGGSATLITGLVSDELEARRPEDPVRHSKMLGLAVSRMVIEGKGPILKNMIEEHEGKRCQRDPGGKSR